MAPASGEKNSAARDRTATVTATRPGRTPASPRQGGGRVGGVRPVYARQGAVRIDEAGLLGDADQGAGVVEHVDEEEREDNGDRADLQRLDDIELQEHGGDRRRQ